MNPFKLERLREVTRLKRRKNRAAYFEGKVCVDCGTAERLELDHADPSTKYTHRIWTHSPARREAELAKCVPRCTPCHRAKSANESRVRNRERYERMRAATADAASPNRGRLKK